MIVGVGVDLTRASRIERALDRHGRRFVERILHPDERRACFDSPRPARFLARRFAAKEAVAKACGTGIGAALGWHDVRVARCDSGQPRVDFGEACAPLRERLGIAGAHLSLADDGDYAIAFAVLVSASL